MKGRKVIVRRTDRKILFRGSGTLVRVLEARVRKDESLSYANLSGADLSYANLSDANLSGANLSCADLSDANLSGANLSCADLSEANLFGANLFGANLSRADLSEANLFRAHLVDSHYSPIQLLTQCAWGNVSAELCRDLMRLDAEAHPRPDLFGVWAKGGECPLGGLGRACHFVENKSAWRPGRAPTVWSLWMRLAKEKGITTGFEKPKKGRSK